MPAAGAGGVLSVVVDTRVRAARKWRLDAVAEDLRRRWADALANTALKHLGQRVLARVQSQVAHMLRERQLPEDVTDELAIERAPQVGEVGRVALVDALPVDQSGCAAGTTVADLIRRHLRRR